MYLLKSAPLGLALALSLAAGAAGAEERTTAIGQAAVVDNDKVRARDKALEDAQRKAVEQAVGAMISSETVTANYELVSDKILSKASGYVKNVKILSEGIEDGVYNIKIECDVASGNLQNDVNGIMSVLKAK